MYHRPSLFLSLIGGLLLSSTILAQRLELNIQTGHAAQVLAIAFTRDGKLLASGSVDKTIILWDPATGTQLTSFKGHDGTVNSLAFSPDDRLLASASADLTVKIWDVASGRVLQTLSGHTLHVSSVAFSPDGRLLASASGDQTAKIWDVGTGRELRTMNAAANPRPGMGVSVAFSRDGKTLVTAIDVVKFWDVGSGKEIRTLAGLVSNSETPIAFSRDGKLLATGGPSVKLWDVVTARELRTIPGDTVALSFGADDQTLAGTTRTEVKVWNVATGQDLRTWNGPNQGVDTVNFSSDGRTLASGNSDNTIILWDPSSDRQLRVLKGQVAGVASIALSADGRTLANGIVGEIGRKDTIKIWDPATGQLLRSLLNQTHHAYSIGLSADGNTLVSGSSGLGIGMWNVGQPTPLQRYRSRGFVADQVALSPDGKLIAAGGRDNAIKILEAATGRELYTLTGHSRSIRELAFSPDGKILASSSQDTTIKLWSVATGQELRTLRAHAGGVTSVAFSPDGKKLASGSQDKLIVIWDVATGEDLRGFYDNQAWVNAVAFSHDGLKLAGGTEDGIVRVWSTSSGSLLHTLKGHVDRVNAVAFSADDKMVISGSSDTTLKVWDTNSGKQLASLFSINQQDWLVLTPDGLFDGSPAAWNQIRWRFSSNLFDVAPVELFFNEYYYPGLLADLYAGKRPVAPENISQKDRRQPILNLSIAGNPSPTIKTRNVSVRIEIPSAPAGAQDVRLFRNGALVKVWRGDVLKMQNRVVLEAQVPIVAGENRLTAYGFNRDNVKSADAQLTVVGDESLTQPGTLYVLAIAVNKYENPQFDLRYAVADATDFAAELQQQETQLKNFARTELIQLQDTQATKANVLGALATLATRVKPEDALMVYYAGHGTAQQNQFFLIPHDLGYRGPRNAVDAAGLKSVLAHSISDRELERAFEKIDAGQFVLIIDACNSGQALEAEEKRRGPMNSKGLAQLAYEKGIYILTAAQSYQAALEPSDLKHGLLTYALVEEGLKKRAADSEPQDGTVHVREWFGYVVKRVPQMQEQRMRQASQSGRQLVYLEGDESTDAGKRNIQRPRVFYRRELEERPFIIARFEQPN